MKKLKKGDKAHTEITFEEARNYAAEKVIELNDKRDAGKASYHEIVLLNLLSAKLGYIPVSEEASKKATTQFIENHKDDPELEQYIDWDNKDSWLTTDSPYDLKVEIKKETLDPKKAKKRKSKEKKKQRKKTGFGAWIKRNAMKVGAVALTAIMAGSYAAKTLDASLSNNGHITLYNPFNDIDNSDDPSDNEFSNPADNHNDIDTPIDTNLTDPADPSDNPIEPLNPPEIIKYPYDLEAIVFGDPEIYDFNATGAAEFFIDYNVSSDLFEIDPETGVLARKDITTTGVYDILFGARNKAGQTQRLAKVNISAPDPKINLSGISDLGDGRFFGLGLDQEYAKELVVNFYKDGELVKKTILNHTPAKKSTLLATLDLSDLEGAIDIEFEAHGFSDYNKVAKASAQIFAGDDPMQIYFNATSADGIFYTISINATDQDDKIVSCERTVESGTYLSHELINVNNTQFKEDYKISFKDGADWIRIKYNIVDKNGNEYKINKKLVKDQRDFYLAALNLDSNNQNHTKFIDDFIAKASQGGLCNAIELLASALEQAGYGDRDLAKLIALERISISELENLENMTSVLQEIKDTGAFMLKLAELNNWDESMLRDIVNGYNNLDELERQALFSGPYNRTFGMDSGDMLEFVYKDLAQATGLNTSDPNDMKILLAYENTYSDFTNETEDSAFVKQYMIDLANYIGIDNLRNLSNSQNGLQQIQLVIMPTIHGADLSNASLQDIFITQEIRDWADQFWQAHEQELIGMIHRKMSWDALRSIEKLIFSELNQREHNTLRYYYCDTFANIEDNLTIAQSGKNASMSESLARVLTAQIINSQDIYCEREEGLIYNPSTPGSNAFKVIPTGSFNSRSKYTYLYNEIFMFDGSGSGIPERRMNLPGTSAIPEGYSGDGYYRGDFKTFRGDEKEMDNIQNQARNNKEIKFNNANQEILENYDL